MEDVKYVTREELDRGLTRVEERCESRLSSHDQSIVELTKALGILETHVNSMLGMPQIIQSVEKTLVQMTEQLKQMNEKIGNVEYNLHQQSQKYEAALSKSNDAIKENQESIESVDGKSKIDFLLWMKKNFFNIVLFLAGVYFILKDAIGF